MALTDKTRHAAREYLAFAAFVLPNLVAILIFVYRPLLLNAYYSLLDWKLGSSNARFVGLANYVRWATDPDSMETLLVTVIFAVAMVGGSLVLGLLLSLALSLKVPGVGVARTAIFTPYVLSGVGIGLVWLFIFDPVYGPLRPILALFHVPSPDWYLNGRWALVMVIIVAVWQHAGYAAIVYLAGLQTIPPELSECAELDGCSGVSKLRHVTLPLLSPVTFFLLITMTLGALKQFDLIKIMTGGGPFDSTRTLMFQVYEEAFVKFRAGSSAAVSIVVFVICLVITLVQLRVGERRVHYA